MAGRKENLKPKTSPQARGKLGGIKSVQVRKEKKLMSQIYADILADQSGIKRGGGIRAVVAEILNSTDPRVKAAKVSLIRELREGTEGSKLKTETVLTINADDEKVQQVLKDFGVNKPESKN